jgi:hypothetical protein
MPIELSPAVVADALARLGEHDLDAAPDVEGALAWIAGGEDAEAPLLLSRYDLQVFLWYQLPRKWLIPLDEKRTVAARLGRFLELVGGRAGDCYAGICTSEETMRLLRAWEGDDPGAGEMLRAALASSGIEPPDTDALEWGSVMGLEEGRLRDEVALELERALEGGRLRLGGRGFERRQAGCVADWLRRPRADRDGRTAIDLISEERLVHWARRGSDERQAMLAPVVPRATGRVRGRRCRRRAPSLDAGAWARRVRLRLRPRIEDRAPRAETNRGRREGLLLALRSRALQPARSQ